MKKICLLLLVLSITISAIACDSSDNNSSSKFDSTAEVIDNSDTMTSADDSSEDISDNSSNDIEDSSDDLSYASSDTTSDDSSDASAETSGDDSSDVISDSESSEDPVDNPAIVPTDRYPVKFYYDCTEFVESEKDNYPRFLNPERLGEIYEIDLIHSNPNVPEYVVQSTYTDARDPNLYGITIYPLEDVTENISRYLKWEFSQYSDLDVIPATRIEEFMKTTSCYQYKKEGIDVFLVGEIVTNRESKKCYCFFLYVCCKIEGYIFTIDLYYDAESPNVVPFPTEEREYGWIYDRWPTQEEYEANLIFKDCEWKYELLNIYNEDSQLIALLKEMVAEQG